MRLHCHLESYTPVQDRAKSYVPVRTGTYRYMPVHASTGFLEKYVLVRTGIFVHVSPDDYQGEIARIMAKSMHDAKTEITLKYNARAISDFRLKTVRYGRFVCNEMHCI